MLFRSNALLNMGNIRASQYGTAGSALNTALNTDWSKVGDKISGWFKSTPETPTSTPEWT